MQPATQGWGVGGGELVLVIHGWRGAGEGRVLPLTLGSGVALKTAGRC